MKIRIIDVVLIAIILGLLIIPNLYSVFNLLTCSRSSVTVYCNNMYVIACIFGLVNSVFVVKSVRTFAISCIKKMGFIAITLITIILWISALYLTDYFIAFYNFYRKEDTETLLITVYPLLIEIYSLILMTSNLLSITIYKDNGKWERPPLVLRLITFLLVSISIIILV